MAPPPPTPLWIWLSDIRHLSELHIAVFFCYTPEQKQADPGFWPAGVRRSVFESFPEMQWDTSASVRPRVPLLLHSAYWAASPGVRTESLTNIKALCWCGFVQCLELQGLTLHSLHTKSKETCAGVCECVCMCVFVVNKLRTLLIQWEHSIEHPEMMATFNSTLFETWFATVTTGLKVISAHISWLITPPTTVRLRSVMTLCCGLPTPNAGQVCHSFHRRTSLSRPAPLLRPRAEPLTTPHHHSQLYYRCLRLPS